MTGSTDASKKVVIEIDRRYSPENLQATKNAINKLKQLLISMHEAAVLVEVGRLFDLDPGLKSFTVESGFIGGGHEDEVSAEGPFADWETVAIEAMPGADTEYDPSEFLVEVLNELHLAMLDSETCSLPSTIKKSWSIDDPALIPYSSRISAIHGRARLEREFDRGTRANCVRGRKIS